MLSSKGKYGLKALIHLARLPTGTTAQASDIAELNDIPKKYLDSILGDLRVSGFVRTRKGPGGGYSLSRPPRELILGDIIRALDGPLAPIPCASRTDYQPCADCSDPNVCSVRLLMLEVRDRIADVLDNRSLAELMTTDTQLRQVLSYEI